MRGRYFLPHLEQNIDLYFRSGVEHGHTVICAVVLLHATDLRVEIAAVELGDHEHSSSQLHFTHLSAIISRSVPDNRTISCLRAVASSLLLDIAREVAFGRDSSHEGENRPPPCCV
ncbi:hypothetical protein CB0940_03219 [Cercospora beticola]|uniref:Uncharacterized protein n=1 Tax=Cercospora beticola TaxID=122368 RepID=A0A2G5I242_CERBT|nr:hypothetical protein CB0940_03219 [Cercospora beticola]PIA98849.1 hypothetical protein CB0940_03219 [Cercospora beticola]CAK1361399.1 unnamed protein product [Cercospora beticola]